MRLAFLVFLGMACCFSAGPSLAAGNPPAEPKVNFVVDSAKLTSVRNSELATHLRAMGEELRLLVEARANGLPAPTLTTDTPVVFEKNGFTVARLGVGQLNMLFIGGKDAPVQACIDTSSLNSTQKSLPVATAKTVER